MDASKHSLLESINPNVAPEAQDRIERAEIDASCRGPVMVFFGSAIFWLLVGTLAALLASIKLHSPTFLGDYAWLTFGRVRPVHLNVVAYGWAAAAGVGVGIWLMARLCKVRLRHPNLIIAAGVLWNLGIAAGVVAILAGYGTSVEWLEFPPFATYILFLSYALISVWAIIMFRFRQPGHVYVSQWYLFGAFFWFPWLYGVANIMINLAPVQGSVQAIVNWWYGHNALGLWFTPLGLATAYYMIPKVIGRPVHSYYLSIIGFWSLALFYSWNGMHHLIGGPVPSWLQSASIVASVMMVIPVITTAINHHMTMRGHFHMLKYSPTLRFVVFGAMMYTAASLQGSLMAVRWFNQLTHFTHYTIGHSHLGLYAFFTMTMFGAMYYIVPRLVGWEWPSAGWIKVHFWCSAIGIVFMIGVLTLGGFIQAFALADPKISFTAILEYMKPFMWLRSFSGILITVGHVAFAVLFIQMCLKLGQRREGPTYFARLDTSKPEAAS
jgi:cytochrome c oxidase cbb3-type subunit 1